MNDMSTKGDSRSSGSGGNARVFPCESCGADLEFHIGTQHLKCTHCGFEKEISLDEAGAVVERDLGAMLSTIAKRRKSGVEPSTDERQVSCRACAGTVVFQGTIISSECPYCGSTTSVESTPGEGDAPEAVIEYDLDSALENAPVGWASEVVEFQCKNCSAFTASMGAGAGIGRTSNTCPSIRL